MAKRRLSSDGPEMAKRRLISPDEEGESPAKLVPLETNTFKTDRFSKLPPEICLRVLFSVDSFRKAVNLSHASPALFRQLGESQGSVLRRHVLNDLGGPLLQDALAIILFPSFDTQKYDVRVVESHLRTWGAKQLPDPFEQSTYSAARIFELEALCHRLWLFIEDYLSKATSPCLPRAYRRLPKWSHSHFSQNFIQRQLSPDDSHFDAGSLSRHKKDQILQAFLRYELLGKIYGPGGGSCLLDRFKSCQYRDSHGVKDVSDGYEFDEARPFLYWDWSLLYKYNAREPQSSELHLLPCIREYVITLYMALIADQIRMTLPPRRLCSEFENFPSNKDERFQDFNPDTHWDALYRFVGTGWSDRLVSLMATAGFSLLTNLLASSGSDFRRFIEAFNKEDMVCPPHIDATNVNLPITAPSRKSRISWHCNNFIRLYRQCAWALFDEDDDYPRPRLPTEDEYGEMYGPGPVDGLVGWGLENDDTRNERVCHGRGVISYPSLSSKLMPFWKASRSGRGVDNV